MIMRWDVSETFEKQTEIKSTSEDCEKEEKLKCTSKGCEKEANLKCPICREKGIPKIISMFCSQECFKHYWKDHSELHNMKLEWTEELAREILERRKGSAGDCLSTVYATVREISKETDIYFISFGMTLTGIVHAWVETEIDGNRVIHDHSNGGVVFYFLDEETGENVPRIMTKMEGSFVEGYLSKFKEIVRINKRGCTLLAAFNDALINDFCIKVGKPLMWFRITKELNLAMSEIEDRDEILKRLLLKIFDIKMPAAAKFNW